MSVSSLRQNKWATLVVLSLGVSLIVIDGTIVNVALPVIIRDLHMDLTGAQWVTTLYALVFAGLLITTGRLGDRLGRRRLFLVGVGVFVAGSVWAGFSDAAGSLLGARVVQGVGGALILPSTLSTVNATFHGRDRAVAFAVWGSVISGMAAVGPLLGGWLTTDFSWQWIFFVNIPVGAILVAGIILCVPETRGQGLAPGQDFVGFGLSALGLAAIVFGLVEGGTYGWWSSTKEFALGSWTWPKGAALSPAAVGIIGGVILLVLFVLWEAHRARIRRSALLNLALFRLPTFRWGNIAVLVVSLGEFGLLFALPLYLQNALGMDPLGAGWVLVAMAAGAFAAGASASRLAPLLGPPTVAAIGLAAETAGLLILALTVHATTPGWLVALILVLYGAGLGLASAQLTGIALDEVPADQSGQGSATQSTMRQLGSALGAAVLGTVLGSAVAAAATGSLDGVPGIPPALRNQLESQLGPSAGGVITQVRVGAIKVPSPDQTASALAAAFADGTRITLLAAAIVLAAGLIAALRLRALHRAAHRPDAAEATVEPDTAG